jgi:hypothetical protein
MTMIYALSAQSRKFRAEAAREAGLDEISAKFPLMVDFLTRCTLPEAEDRPTVQEALEHPIFWTSDMVDNFYGNRLTSVLATPGAVILRNVLGEDGEIENFRKISISKVYDAVRLAETYSENLQVFFERYAMVDLWASEDERLARVVAALQGREVVGLDRLLDESLLSEFCCENSAERKNSAVTLPQTPHSAGDSPWRYAVQCPPQMLDVWRSSSP